MAKKNARLKDFFEGKRRQCSLQDYRPLKTKAGERRLKLSVEMPLSNMPVDGMPDDFTEEYALMEREKSKVNLSKVAVELEGALYSIFSTDTIGRPSVTINGATLNSFRLIGDGVEDQRTVSLEFTVYLPWTDDLRDWCGIHLHEDFFAEVVPSQMELVEEEPVEKPIKAKGKKKDKQASFDPEAIQKAAKRGELVQ